MYPQASPRSREAEKQSQANTAAIPDRIHSPATDGDHVLMLSAEPLTASTELAPPAHVTSTLAACRNERDVVDLREVLRSTTEADNDVEKSRAR